MEMAEVSNRVNFGSWAGRLTCPEKSGQREFISDDIGTCPGKKVWNSVSGKYRTGLHLINVGGHRPKLHHTAATPLVSTTFFN